MHYTIPINTVSLLEQIDVWYCEYSMCAIIRDGITKQTIDHVIYNFRGTVLALDFDSVNNWIQEQCTDPKTIDQANELIQDIVETMGPAMDDPRLVNLQVSVHKIDKIHGGIEITNDVAKILPELLKNKDSEEDSEED